MGRARAEGRHAAGRGRHLVAGPRRRLPAGRARAADRLGQGRGAPAAARRPQRPCAGARQPRHAGADQHAGDGRGGGGAARGAGRPHREARDARQAARRAGAAPRHRGARRRLRRRRAVRRSAQRLGLSRAARATSSSGRWTSSSAAARAWRPIPSTTASARRRRRLPRAAIAASRKRHRLRRRHHRQRRGDAGEVPRAAARIGTIEEGFIARLRKGDCFFFAGRMLEYVRTQDMAAYVRSAPRQQGRRVTTLGTAARCRCRANWPTRCWRCWPSAAQGDFFEPELQAARPMLRDAGAALAAADAGHAAGRALPLARGPAPVPLSVRRPQRAHRASASLLAWRLARDAPNTFSISINDYGFELLSAVPVDPAPLVDQRAVRRRATCCTTCSRASTRASWRSGAFARSRASPGWSSPAIPAQPKSARQLQASSALFYEVFRKYDARQPAARPGARAKC